MRASRLLPGVVLCLLLIPRVLHAQDAPQIVIHGITGFAQKPLVFPSLLCKSRFCTKSQGGDN
jgi:hypothetical protein